MVVTLSYIICYICSITDTSQPTNNVTKYKNVLINHKENKSNSVTNNNLITNVGYTSKHVTPPTTTPRYGVHHHYHHHYVTTNSNHANNVKNNSMHTENGTTVVKERTLILQSLSANYFRMGMLHEAKDAFP